LLTFFVLLGTLSTGGYPKNCPVFVGVPHLPNRFKLCDEDGSIVRIQETHLAELLECFHRFCPNNGSVFDLCTGTGSSMLAILRLGLKGVVNERDERAIDLGVVRARRYVEYLLSGCENQYPRLGERLFKHHDSSDLYGWVRELLLKKAKVAAWHVAWHVAWHGMA
jgi:hypothetical protein